MQKTEDKNNSVEIFRKAIVFISLCIGCLQDSGIIVGKFYSSYLLHFEKSTTPWLIDENPIGNYLLLCRDRLFIVLPPGTPKLCGTYYCSSLQL